MTKVEGALSSAVNAMNSSEQAELARQIHAAFESEWEPEVPEDDSEDDDDSGQEISRLRAEVDMLRQAVETAEDMASYDTSDDGGWEWEAMKSRTEYEEAMSRLRELEKS